MSTTIVTAFYNIGGEMDEDEMYKSFLHLAWLKNPIVLYTDYKNVDRFYKISKIKHNLEIVYEPLYKNRSSITFIEDSMNTDNPENVYLKNKKIDYVNRAISKFALVDYVAWVDVDYINSMDMLPEDREWNGAFRDDINVWTKCRNDDFMNRHDMADTFNFISTRQQGLCDSIMVAPPHQWRWLSEEIKVNEKWCERRNIMTTNDILMTMVYKYFNNKDRFILRYGPPTMVDRSRTVTQSLA